MPTFTVHNSSSSRIRVTFDGPVVRTDGNAADTILDGVWNVLTLGTGATFTIDAGATVEFSSISVGLHIKVHNMSTKENFSTDISINVNGSTLVTINKDQIILTARFIGAAVKAYNEYVNA